MAESDDTVSAEALRQIAAEQINEDTNINYKAPAKVDIATLHQLDADDESLNKYKKQLLGDHGGDVLKEGDANVIVKSMALRVAGREDIVLDLTGSLKDLHLVIKEASTYRLVINFRVQNEIVAGLRFRNTVYRKGIKIDSSYQMVGSYGPKTEVQTYVSMEEDAPSGLLSRGNYVAKSVFTDDDGNDHLSWEWKFAIKKDWGS